MKSRLKLSLLAGLLLATGLTAYAQSPMRGPCESMMGMQGGMGGPGMMHERMGKWDPAKMQAMMDRRHAALKAQLKLTPEQEPAWKTFTDATKLPAGMMAKRPDPADMAKLTTPERIDKMKALRTQHMSEMAAAMDQRGEAVKAFYAVLTPEQQKVFDAHVMQGPGHFKGRRPAPMKG